MGKIQELISTAELAEGNAPFVKHLIVENFTGCQSGVVKITPENTSHLKSKYEARRDGELKVLVRWFESSDVEVPQAPFLDIVLYTKEHLSVEGVSIEEDYGIVSIASGLTPEEVPPSPITIFRNAIGVDEGGNGLKLDHDYYNYSVDYYSRFATVK